MTEYVVLKQVEGRFEKVGYFKASSSEAAVRQAAGKLNEAATLVAVPSRSFRPVVAILEQTTAIRLGSPDDAAARAEDPAA